MDLFCINIFTYGRRDGLMVSTLDSGSSGRGFKLVRGTAFYLHSVSLHPGVSMRIGKLNASGNPAMDRYPTVSFKGGIEL